MLDHEARRVPPVVEQLRAEDVAADAPDGLVPFAREPLVAEVLRVEVVDLEGAVVHVCGRVCVQEEAVVVHVLGPAVDVGEEGDVFSCILLLGRGGGGGVVAAVVVGVRLRHPEKIRRDDVEVARVELDLRLEILDAETVVTQLEGH